MGFRHPTVFLINLLLLSAGFSLLAQMGGGDMPATMGDLAAPIFDQKAQSYIGVLYAKKGQVAGYRLDSVRFDFVKKEVLDPSKIVDVRPAKLYPNGSDSAVLVNAFWDRFPHSQSMMESPRVHFIPLEKRLTGDDEIRFYSRDADMKGVGFVIDFEARTIELHDKVELIIRPKAQKDGEEGLSFGFFSNRTPENVTDSKIIPTSQPKGSKL